MDQLKLNIICRLVDQGIVNPLILRGVVSLYFTATRLDLDQNINIRLYRHNCQSELP